MKIPSLLILGLSIAPAAFTPRATACDLCAIYNVMDAQTGGGKGFSLGVSEQFTHFGTLQTDGHKISNVADQRLDSSITQIALGYNFNSRFGIQLNAPFIYREFRRPEEGRGIREDSTAGVGDLSLVANFVAVRHETEKSTFAWTLTAGLKFPTGSTRRLREETQEGHHHGAEAEPAEAEGHEHAEADHDEGAHAARQVRRTAVHAGVDHSAEAEAETEAPAEELPESGIHGHDLTLGSGSVDGLVGTSVFLRRERVFFTAGVQYAIRSEGSYNYRFANDLIWTGGPGVYLALEDKYTAAVQLNCSGEYKKKDRFRGADSEDTGITAVYLGPEVRVTWKDRVSAELGADFPVSIDNTATQIVPDYRLRASISVRF